MTEFKFARNSLNNDKEETKLRNYIVDELYFVETVFKSSCTCGR